MDYYQYADFTNAVNFMLAFLFSVDDVHQDALFL